MMVAPKAPGHTVRSEFTKVEDSDLIAIHQDATGNTKEVSIILCFSNWWRKNWNY